VTSIQTLFFEKDFCQKGGREGAGKHLTPQRWGEGGGKEGETPGTAKRLEVNKVGMGRKWQKG